MKIGDFVEHGPEAKNFLFEHTVFIAEESVLLFQLGHLLIGGKGGLFLLGAVFLRVLAVANEAALAADFFELLIVKVPHFSQLVDKGLKLLGGDFKQDVARKGHPSTHFRQRSTCTV